MTHTDVSSQNVTVSNHLFDIFATVKSTIWPRPEVTSESLDFQDNYSSRPASPAMHRFGIIIYSGKLSPKL